jgi:hypothetical protein
VPTLPYDEYWHIELESLRIENNALLKKYPEAMEPIERVHGILSDIASLPGCTPKKLGKATHGPR